MSEQTAHMIYEATTHQIAGLEAERAAHLMQIAGLVEERDALRCALATATADARKWRRAYAGEHNEGAA